MSETLFEKLQYQDEKNLLIQGLPSTIEKQFCKLAFAKNVTPLLKSRRIDFALVFAINESQLNGILKEVLPAMHTEGKFWVAYPKTSSKIATDLNRDCSWYHLTSAGYESVQTITLDHVWSAAQFKKSSDPLAGLMHQEEEDEAVLVAETVGVNYTMRVVTPPADFAKLLLKSQKANAFFEKLSVTNQKEYVGWINSAKREETRLRRVEAAVGKLEAGKKNPSEK
jgi:hypothetical protein